MIILPVGIQVKPPLLQMYILPSGPSAAPLGPPGICATTSLRPSGQIRVSLLPRISTSTTEPSGITTGPSGNSRSVARTRTLDMMTLPAACYGLRGMSGTGPHARFACGYDKVASACQASGQVCQRCAALLLHRHPDLEAAIAGCGIEFFVIALEVRRVCGLQAGGGQPLIPDRVDGAADRGDVICVGEHGIAVLRDTDATEAAAEIGKIGDLDPGDIVEIAGVVAVAANAVRHLADARWNVGHVLVEALPHPRDDGAVVAGDAFSKTRDEESLCGFETRGCKIFQHGGFHEDRLLKLEVIDARRRPHRFRRDAKMVAERAGE